MGRLLVIGRGVVGGAIAAAAGAGDPSAVALDPVAVDPVAVDPVTMPSLLRRDDAAAGELRRLLDDTGATAVVNAAGLTRGSEPELDDANVAFPAWLCEVLDGTGLRLVHVGSASEYGDPGTAEPVAEDHPAAPRGPYATSKARGTQAVLDARTAGLDAVVARLFNLAARPVPPTSPVQEWLDALAAAPPVGGSVDVWWPPTRRDFVTVGDAARALVDLAGPGARPPVVNVCSGVGLAFGDIVHALAERLGRSVTVRSLERPGIAAVVGDPALLAATIGWHPAMTLDRLAEAVAGVGDPDANP